MIVDGRMTYQSLFTKQTLVDGPYGEPIDLADARAFLRLSADANEEDLVLNGLIAAARRQVEADTGRAMLYQRRSISLDGFPDGIEIYAGPVRSDVLPAITYLDPSGSSQTLATTVYKVRYDLEPATISLKFAQVWPFTYCESGAVNVTFSCGYAVPFTITPATGLLTFSGFTPTNGNTYRLSNSGGTLPSELSVNTLYYVVNASGSTCKLATSSGGTALTFESAGTGSHFLGQIHPAALNAMRMLIAVRYADREGSIESAKCRQAYMDTIAPLMLSAV